MNEHGFNRASALTNVVEANRHVIYATDARGRTVARKLIAVSSDGALLGYRTYAYSDTADHKEALDRVCADFADDCSLPLASTGLPKSLTGGFWYDDGLEPWEHSDARASWRQGVVLQMSEWREAPWRARQIHNRLLRSDFDDHVVGTILATSHDTQLIHGLWLDGRVRNPRDVFRLHANSRCAGECVNDIPMIDADGYERAMQTWHGPPADLECCVPPLRRSAISAASRANSYLSHDLLVLLPPDEAVHHLRHVTQLLPSPFLMRLLRAKGAAPRRLRQALATWKRRTQDDWDNYWRESDVAAAPNATLRRQLINPETAAEAAKELACRNDRSSAAAVHRAAQRQPHDSIVAAAAAALGAPAGRPKDISQCPPWLARMAARGAPADWFTGVDDDMLGKIAHPDLPPDGMKLREEWDAAHTLTTVFPAARKGHWEPLEQLGRRWPTLLLDPQMEQLIIEALSDHDAMLLAGLARLYSRMDWAPIPVWHWFDESALMILAQLHSAEVDVHPGEARREHVPSADETSGRWDRDPASWGTHGRNALPRASASPSGWLATSRKEDRARGRWQSRSETTPGCSHAPFPCRHGPSRRSPTSSPRHSTSRSPSH